MAKRNNKYRKEKTIFKTDYEIFKRAETHYMEILRRAEEYERIRRERWERVIDDIPPLRR